MINTLKTFLASRGINSSRQFSIKTGLPHSTALRLYSDPTAYPSKETQDLICKTFNAKPGDFLDYLPDEELQVG